MGTLNHTTDLDSQLGVDIFNEFGELVCHVPHGQSQRHYATLLVHHFNAVEAAREAVSFRRWQELSLAIAEVTAHV